MRKYILEKWNLILGIFVINLITHGYIFSSRIMNGDYLGDTEFPFSQLLLGRFMPLFLLRIIPPVLGVLTALVITCSTILIINLFELEKNSVVLVVATIISTFPTLAYSFAYMIYVERYIIALFFSVLAVFLTLKVKHKLSFILGGICLSISLGEYQSYIGVAICLSLLYLIMMIIEIKEAKEIFNSFLRLLFMGISGMFLYLVILRICLKLQNTELASYKGFDTLGGLELSGLFKQVINAYYNFVNFILGKNYFSVGWIQYIIFGLLLVGIVGSFMAVFKKSKLHAFFMFLLIGFMPLGVFVIDVISLTAQANAMQIYQMTIVLILPTVLLDKVFLLESNKKILKYFSAVVIIATLLLSANYFIYDNAYYTRSAAYSEQTTLLINRVWSRIESMTEYNQNKNIPILILMDMQPLYEKAVPIYEDYIEFDMGYYDRFIGFNQLDSIIGTGKFAGQMHNKLGIDIITANREQMAQIYENPEYLTIGTWPEESSIKIIDGVLVVNLATVIYSEIDESEDVIRVTAKSPSENIEYAFYLYVDGHHEYTQWYGKEGVFEIPKEYLVNAKNYQVEIFCVDEKGKSLGKRYTPVIKVD